ncbi:MAG: diguanylate cyclase [bacterium]|nr:diguanylate cyclase [bacterium]
MERILIVEDSAMIAEAIRREVLAKLKFECDVAHNFEHAKEILDRSGDDYFIATLDLNLPDACEGEIVDYVLAKNIPSVVFTGTFDDEIRERMMAENILDYVVKEGPQAVEQLIHIIQRIHRNQFIKVMVVDDSSTSRRHLASLLKSQRYEVLEARHGKEALQHLKKNTDVKLVITDYNMPVMDGFELISRIRQNYKREQLAIIGISAYGTGLLSARFLKKGANDFLIKPFVEEEFYSRINQNIEMLEYIEEIKKASNVDYLTGLFNRRYFFQFGEKLFANARRANFSMTIAMIDIDSFKKVNDTYGHYTGDIVLKHVGKLLDENLRDADILARYGGEEFCIITTNMKKEDAEVLFNRLRLLVETQQIPTDRDPISGTISIGVCTTISDSLDATINQADALLYKAKNAGRNRVEIE